LHAAGLSELALPAAAIADLRAVATRSARGSRRPSMRDPRSCPSIDFAAPFGTCSAGEQDPLRARSEHALPSRARARALALLPGSLGRITGSGLTYDSSRIPVSVFV
jgi:hypothetical protein